MNHRTETHTESPEQLIKNIQKLMDEVEAVVAKSTDTAGSALGEKLGDLRERFNSARTSAQGYYKIAKRKVADGAEAADETIRSHPYESLAVALGLGVVLGALLRRRD
ncbi:MAG TPA: hypothetical protein VHV47_07590 [Opitutaceae bacterium]|jgi:ElaB/YqjD/DUF883 family membrane-anchored ribosome-binding protein|nr:hypothetical protein [Opitutaceae bacterium]